MNINDHEYKINEQGVLQQVNPNVITYDSDYVSSRYGAIIELRKQMSMLRYGYMTGCIGKPTKILEIGYGAGDFIQLCAEQDIKCFGNDITGIPTPPKVTATDNIFEQVDVVCMFDVLEHFEDINFIKDLNTKYVYVSVPNCSQPTNIEYLSNDYIHLRPNEHLHHFNIVALINHFDINGYKLLTISNIEDTIRRRPNTHANILSAIFEKENLS
jgi:hypothetical protein